MATVQVLISSTLVFGLGPISPWGIDGIVTGTLCARICGGVLMLSVLTRGVPHFPQQSFVHPTEGLDVLGAVEMDVIDQVDDVPEHIPACGVIPKIAKHRGDHVAPLAAGAIAAQTS